MLDDTQEREPADRTQINVNDSYELQYWSKQFGCSTDELWEAVTTAGVEVKDVAAYLDMSDTDNVEE